MIACCWFGVSQSTGSSSMIPRSSAKAAVASSARPTVRSWSTIHQASLSVTRIPAIWATPRTLRTMVIGASRRVQPASARTTRGPREARSRLVYEGFGTLLATPAAVASAAARLQVSRAPGFGPLVREGRRKRRRRRGRRPRWCRRGIRRQARTARLRGPCRRGRRAMRDGP
jgi:hypothetical protein